MSHRPCLYSGSTSRQSEHRAWPLIVWALLSMAVIIRLLPELWSVFAAVDRSVRRGGNETCLLVLFSKTKPSTGPPQAAATSPATSQNHCRNRRIQTQTTLWIVKSHIQGSSIGDQPYNLRIFISFTHIINILFKVAAHGYC